MHFLIYMFCIYDKACVWIIPPGVFLQYKGTEYVERSVLYFARQAELKLHAVCCQK